VARGGLGCPRALGSPGLLCPGVWGVPPGEAAVRSSLGYPHVLGSPDLLCPGVWGVPPGGGRCEEQPWVPPCSGEPRSALTGGLGGAVPGSSRWEPLWGVVPPRWGLWGPLMRDCASLSPPGTPACREGRGLPAWACAGFRGTSRQGVVAGVFLPAGFGGPFGGGGVQRPSPRRQGTRFFRGSFEDPLLCGTRRGVGGHSGRMEPLPPRAKLGSPSPAHPWGGSPPALCLGTPRGLQSREGWQEPQPWVPRLGRGWRRGDSPGEAPSSPRKAAPGGDPW